MAKLKFFLLVGIIIPLLASCGKEISSAWNNSEITVDGYSGDWKEFPREYDDGMNMLYGVINNDRILNIMVSFNDLQMARNFSARGFTIWFNIDNEEDKLIGINYIDSSARRRPEGVNSEGIPFMRRLNAEDFTGKAPEMHGKFSLFKNDSEFVKSIGNQTDWKAAVAFNDGVYCFEYGIPLEKVVNADYFLDITGKKEIKVCISIAGVSEEEKELMKARMENMRGRRSFGSGPEEGSGGFGGGMGSMGGRAGGRQGGFSGSRQAPDLYGKDIWMTVKLAIIYPKISD